MTDRDYDAQIKELKRALEECREGKTGNEMPYHF